MNGPHLLEWVSELTPLESVWLDLNTSTALVDNRSLASHLTDYALVDPERRLIAMCVPDCLDLQENSLAQTWPGWRIEIHDGAV